MGAPVEGVLDVLKVPKDLPPGEYVLGWRYDCEGTAQVWSNCADVYVASAGPAPEPVPEDEEEEGEVEEEEDDPVPEPAPQPQPEPEQPCFDIVGDVPNALPAGWLPEWLGGELITCDAIQRLSDGRALCDRFENVNKACCFCGGGERDPAKAAKGKRKREQQFLAASLVQESVMLEEFGFHENEEL